MKVYKIWDKTYKKYVSAGLNLSTSSSKTWTKLAHAKSAITGQIGWNDKPSYYEKRYEIVEFELVEGSRIPYERSKKA